MTAFATSRVDDAVDLQIVHRTLLETHIHMVARQLRAAGEDDLAIYFADPWGAVLLLEGRPVSQVFATELGGRVFFHGRILGVEVGW